MKNKLLIITIFSIFLFPLFVSASNVKCTYEWPNYENTLDWEITLSDLDENNVFRKITAGTNGMSGGINFVEEVKLNDDGTCPNIGFYHGGLVGDKIYASNESCKKKFFDGGCVESEFKDQDDSDKTSYNTAGTMQAALANSPDAKTCRYEHSFENGGTSSKVTIYIKKEGDKVTARCENTTIGIASCGVLNIENAGFEADESYTCPSYIYFDYTTDNGVSYCTLQGQGGDADENHSGVETPGSNETPAPDIGFDVGELDCDGIFQGDFGKILKQIIDLVKFAVPIIIIALSIMDFVKSLAAQNQDEINKSTQKLIKRLIIGVLIFALPTILEFVLKIAGVEFGVCAIG